MNNRARLAISAIASLIVAFVAYLLPFTFLLYFFAPGFWLGDALPERAVNALGGYLFPVIASVIIWTLLIYVVWRLMAGRRMRR
ncbi:MAG TPA: hypothetical protein VM095_18970 [Pyrinomonadaceae bacterium]|nr:hypothetical protein [Pyrinomonadaceae bacterium]